LAFGKDRSTIPRPEPYLRPVVSQTQTGLANIIAFGDVRRTISGKANIQPETTSPTAPGSLAVSQSGGCNVLTWTAATDLIAVTGYIIERCSGSSCIGFSVIATVGAGVLTYTDCAVGSGIYRYQVRAQNGGGIIGPPSTPVTVTVTVTSSQVISGVANINGAAVRTITGVANIVPNTPSLGVNETQLALVVDTQPNPPVNVTAVTLVADRRVTQLDVRVTQVALVVRIPYIGRTSHGYSGGTLGLAKDSN
jgi:hypothetical protein